MIQRGYHRPGGYYLSRVCNTRCWTRWDATDVIYPMLKLLPWVSLEGHRRCRYSRTERAWGPSFVFKIGRGGCDNDDNGVEEGGRRGSDLPMELLLLMLLLLLLPAFVGLTGHHGDVGQIATAQITAHVTTGFGITGKGRFADRRRRRRRRRVTREPFEHRARSVQQRAGAAGALTPRYPVAKRVEQPRMKRLIGWWGPIRRRALAIKYRAIRRRPHTFLINLALLKISKFVNTKNENYSFKSDR